MASISGRPFRPMAVLMAMSSSQISRGAPIGGGGPLGARPVAHRRHHLVERPFQIDRGRARGEQRRVSAIQRLVGGVGAQRKADPVGRGRADQRRAADHHGADRMRRLVERGEARGDETMRQRRLIDHADRPAVRLEPDAAHGFAVDFHAVDLADFSGLSMPNGAATCQRVAACRNLARAVRRRRRWPPSTTKPNTTIAPACRNMRKFLRAGRAKRRIIAPKR